MKRLYSSRVQAQGEQAHLLLQWLKTTKNCRKPKLFGYITQYYKFPQDKKLLWVTADYWKLK